MQRRRSCNTKAAPLVSFALSHPFCYLSPSEHDVILRIHHCCACSFLFGWPPCQRSDMTLVEVSQHAYNCLFIRTIVLFVFLRNSCEPDMVLVYFCWINSVWVWVWVSSSVFSPMRYLMQRILASRMSQISHNLTSFCSVETLSVGPVSIYKRNTKLLVIAVPMVCSVTQTL